MCTSLKNIAQTDGGKYTLVSNSIPSCSHTELCLLRASHRDSAKAGRRDLGKEWAGVFGGLSSHVCFLNINMDFGELMGLDFQLRPHYEEMMCLQ